MVFQQLPDLAPVVGFIVDDEGTDHWPYKNKEKSNHQTNKSLLDPGLRFCFTKACRDDVLVVQEKKRARRTLNDLIMSAAPSSYFDLPFFVIPANLSEAKVKAGICWRTSF
jgi:hypothetical protein